MRLFNQDKIILDLCGGTGAWSKPYKDEGYDVKIVTLPDWDVREYMKPIYDVYGILAAPPCTEFSPAKHGRTRNYASGMDVVNACIRIIFISRPKFWALENPSGVLHNFLGNANYTFHPWMFGDPWTKKTSLWGDFNKPKVQYQSWEDVPKNNELYIRPGRKKPSIAFLHKSATNKCFPEINHECKNDAEFRAITPPGFAKAFFEANK